MEVDTGTSLTVISETTMKQIPHLEITPVAAKLRTYTGEVIIPVGQANVNVEYEGQVKVLTVIVTPGSGPSLIGRNWLHHIRLNWKQIFIELKLSEENESVELKTILDKYATVFEEELGTVKRTEVHINLKLDAKPRFCKARPVPYALKPKIDTELDRLVKEGVYVPVGYSRWAAPIVPVLKNDGKVRICGDYKRTINKAAHCENYPLPRTEDLLATLNRGQKFSKLDLSHAYQQLLLDNESREYLTVNTHRGLFQPTRLQFGVHSASVVFQREMEKRLSHIPFTSVRVDDILVSGRSDAEHLSNLKAVLQVIEDCGLRLKHSKCVFMTPEVTYLGFRVNKEGTTPVDDNIAAVMNAPEPVNASQLKSFDGMLIHWALPAWVRIPSLSPIKCIMDLQGLI